MLQKYTFVSKLGVHTLQHELEFHFNKIKGVSAVDSFDPAIYFPAALAKKIAKKNSKTISGKKVSSHNELYKKAEAFFNKYKILGLSQSIVDNAFKNMNKIE